MNMEALAEQVFDRTVTSKPKDIKGVIDLTSLTFNTLACQRDLSPNNSIVTKCLSHYVAEIIAAEERIYEKEKIINNSEIAAIRPKLCALLSRAEYEMEMYFSDLLGREDELDISSLDRFWYRDNYKHLIRQEIEGVRNAHSDYNPLCDDRPFVFVGAGPLPLSAVDYYLETGKPCVCVEMDRAAANAGQNLIDKLGLSDKIHYVGADGADIDYQNYSLIMVASLVANKQSVAEQIRRTAHNAIVGIRSAEGLKALLYEPVNIEKVVDQGFTYCGIAAADERTVNSTCFFQTPSI